MHENILNDKAKKLIATIEKVFAETVYPGDDHLFEGINIDDPDLEIVFCGLHWKQLSLDIILGHKMSLLYFTVDGLVFYLPGYLIQIIRNPEKTEVEEIRSDLLHCLTPLTGTAAQEMSEDEEWAIQQGLLLKENAGYYDKHIDIDKENERWQDIIESLDSDQRKSIRAYMTFMNEFFPSSTGLTEEESLKRYWGKI